MIRGRGDEGITMCGMKNHVNKGAETGLGGDGVNRRKKPLDRQSREEPMKSRAETGDGQLRDDCGGKQFEGAAAERERTSERERASTHECCKR